MLRLEAMTSRQPFSELDEAIVRAVALGDVSNCPLTAQEIWQYMEEKVEASALHTLWVRLEELVAQHILISHRGRYALSGRGVLFAERDRRYRASVSKWRTARFIFSLIAALPGVESIGFYNALGYGNARASGDIDILMIARTGFLWRTRLLAIAVAELFGHRPAPGRNRDGLCLSFFFSPNADLSQVKYQNDPFLLWCLTRINMVSDQNNAYQTWQGNNQWLSDGTPNRVFDSATFYLSDATISWVRPLMRLLLAPVLLMSEKMARAISERFGSRTLHEASRLGDGGVVMQDDLLKLHLVDRRLDHLRELEGRLTRMRRIHSL